MASDKPDTLPLIENAFCLKGSDDMHMPTTTCDIDRAPFAASAIVAVDTCRAIRPVTVIVAGDAHAQTPRFGLAGIGPAPDPLTAEPGPVSTLDG